MPLPVAFINQINVILAHIVIAFMTFTAPFTVVEDNNCPFYKRDDRFFLDEKSVNLPGEQPACLILVRELTSLLFSYLSKADKLSPDKNKVFNCGGCTGLIKFRAGTEGTITESSASRTSDQELSFFEGHLEILQPAELLQVFHMHQKSGKLFFDLSLGSARITFRDGALIAARYGDFDNQEAVYAILGARKGSFRFEPGLPSETMKAREMGDFMMILMEGLRRLDER